MAGMCGGAVSCVLTVALREGRDPPLPQGQPDNCQLNVTLAETLPEASEMIVRMPSQESNLKHTHKKYICYKIIRANLSV